MLLRPRKAMLCNSITHLVLQFSQNWNHAQVFILVKVIFETTMCSEDVCECLHARHRSAPYLCFLQVKSSQIYQVVVRTLATFLFHWTGNNFLDIGEYWMSQQDMWCLYGFRGPDESMVLLCHGCILFFRFWML